MPHLKRSNADVKIKLQRMSLHNICIFYYVWINYLSSVFFEYKVQNTYFKTACIIPYQEDRNINESQLYVKFTFV